MLTRQELVKLIQAWPDENGVSSDPETHNAWMESEKNNFGVWRGSSTVVLKKKWITLEDRIWHDASANEKWSEK